MQSNIINQRRRSSITDLDSSIPVLTADRVSGFQTFIVKGLAELSDSNSSMESDENNDQVTPMANDIVEWTTFRQLDYLWLFDPILKFSERAGLKLEENCISADDFTKMHQINRRSLTTFLKGQQEDAVMDGSENDDENWSDECIDEEIKQLLSHTENGKLISLDIVAHMEYFYNTLECSFKTVNPFESAHNLFPALHSHLNDKTAAVTGVQTLFQQHRTLIYPNSPAVKTQSQSGSNKESHSLDKISSVESSEGSQAIAELLLPKKYQWYPNIKI
jgi:hypothetical protein